jgi:hypothetical protein
MANTRERVRTRQITFRCGRAKQLSLRLSTIRRGGYAITTVERITAFEEISFLAYVLTVGTGT